MENKYFNPSIEDIRVGYECEIFTTEWMPYRFYEFEIPWFLKNHSVGANYFLEKLRVPYLTKEQIEAEEWEEYKNGFRKMCNGAYMYITHYKIQFGDGWKRQLVVHSENGAVHFRGECWDINTFRMICKLLEI